MNTWQVLWRPSRLAPNLQRRAVGALTRHPHVWRFGDGTLRSVVGRAARTSSGCHAVTSTKHSDCTRCTSMAARTTRAAHEPHCVVSFGRHLVLKPEVLGVMMPLTLGTESMMPLELQNCRRITHSNTHVTSGQLQAAGSSISRGCHAIRELTVAFASSGNPWASGRRREPRARGWCPHRGSRSRSRHE